MFRSEAGSDPSDNHVFHRVMKWFDTVRKILNWIWNFLSNIEILGNGKQFKNQLIRNLKESKNKMKSQLMDHSLDSRWIQVDEDNYKFNFDSRALQNINQTFATTNEKLSSVSLTGLIKDIQHVNNQIKLSTNISSQWISSSNLTGNQKQRKLRQLKHDLYMAKRRNSFREKIFKQKQAILNGKNVESSTSKKDVMMQVYKEQLEKERTQKDYNHIIQDFDFIQQIYREKCQDALEIEYEQSLFTQKSMDDIQQENQTLENIVHQYFHGIKNRDEALRSINKEIFMDFDDDPFQLAFPFKPNDMGYNQKLPKMNTMSMRTEQDRERRRQYILHPSPLANITEKEAQAIENQRVTSVLTHLLKKQGSNR